MIRLTVLLLAGIGVTLSVAGRDLDHPMGSNTGVDMARAQTDLTDPTPGLLALDDEAGAIERAIAATDSYTPGAAQASTADAQDAVASTDGTAWPTATVNANRVNLRAGPSTANQVLDQVVRDQTVEILGTTDDGWAEVRVVKTGLTAYIFDRFLTTQG